MIQVKRGISSMILYFYRYEARIVVRVEILRQGDENMQRRDPMYLCLCQLAQTTNRAMPGLEEGYLNGCMFLTSAQ